MKRATLATAMLLGFAALSSPAMDARAFTPTSLTFFGDSLTDSGNGDLVLAGFGLPDLTPSPPFAAGVVSDGPIWAQRLAASFGRAGDATPSMPPVGGRNFAVGTARTGQLGASGLSIGMLSQAVAYGGSGLVTDPTGLYAVFGGANDIFDAAGLANDTAREAALATAVGNLATISQGLYGLGARHFLVPNSFDLGRTPAAATGDPTVLGALSRRFNELLGDSLTALSATLPGSTFYGLSLDVLQGNVAYDALMGGTLYGITNVSLPCFAAGAPACGVSAFVDDRHPTTALHELIADAAFARVVQGVDVSPVPEPVPAVLFALGAGLLTIVARRRSRGTAFA